MRYREIGHTGKQASMLGLGCEHLDGKPYAQVEETLHAALDLGVNILDVFMPGDEVRGNIAKALGNRREDVMIQGHLGSSDVGQQYDISRDMPTVQKFFEQLLRHFGYIDFGMLFFIDSEEDFHKIFDTEFITYAQERKKQGDIRHIGFSSHHPKIAKMVVETGLVESMLFSINPAFDLYPADDYVLDSLEKGFDTEAFRGVDPERTALYQLCEQKGVGITVMKTLGAGKLLSTEQTPFARPLTVQQCMHYALSRPAVSSVLLGCQSGEELRQAAMYFEMDEAALDFSDILHTMRNDFRGSCVYCNHCLPCPSDIDIASVNRYLDIAKLDKDAVPPSVRSHYGELAHTGSECIGCGSCESKCPFGVPVIENMAEAATVFGR